MDKTLVLGNTFVPFTSSRSQLRPRSILTHAKVSTHRDSPAQVCRDYSIGIAGLLAAAPAWADQAAQELQQKGSQLSKSLPSPDQLSGAVQTGSGGGFFDLFADNPVLLGGLVLLAASPLLFRFISGGALGVKQVNAAGAVEGLTSDPSTVLVDIRNRNEIKEQGAPNLASTKKKAIILPFTQVIDGEVEELENFAQNFSKLKKIKPDSSIILLDSFGKEAPKAAKLLATAVDRVYYVQDGAVGPRGWRESGQAWREPGQSILSGLSLDNLAEDFKAQPTVAKAGIAAGALGLAGAVLFQEVGTAIELAAVAAAGAVFVPRFASSSSVSEALPDATSETTKRQVKDFVKESSKAEKSLENKAKAVASDVQSEAQSVADSGDLSTAKAQASKATGQAENKAEEVGKDIQKGASDAAQAAENSAEEAKEWIESWRKDQAKK